MVSKAHHCGVSRLAKAVSRRMLSRVMEKPPKAPRSRTRALEVHVMYEPSRLAQHNLQDAYASLVPTVRRRMGLARSTAKPAQSRAERKAQ